MPAPGTVWASNSWSVDAWAANTWENAIAAVVLVPPFRAEISVTSRTPGITVTSRTPLISVGDA